VAESELLEDSGNFHIADYFVLVLQLCEVVAEHWQDLAAVHMDSQRVVNYHQDFDEQTVVQARWLDHSDMREQVEPLDQWEGEVSDMDCSAVEGLHFGSVAVAVAVAAAVVRM
jgi:hypothetical protein